MPITSGSEAADRGPITLGSDAVDRGPITLAGEADTNFLPDLAFD